MASDVARDLDSRSTRLAHALRALLLLPLLFFLAGLVVGPPVEKQRCGDERWHVVNAHLGAGFGISMIKDSLEFIKAARNPLKVLRPRAARQTRPGAIFATYGLAKILRRPTRAVLTGLIPASTAAELGDYSRYHGIESPTPCERFREPRSLQTWLYAYAPEYVAWVLLNFLVLFAALGLALRIVQPSRGGTVAATTCALLLLLVINDLSRAFLFSPHLQFFLLLVPVSMVWLGMQQRQDPGLSDRRWPLRAAALGVGLITYPLFALAIASVGLRGLLALPGLPASARCRAGRRLALILAVCLLPAALWIGVVLVHSGGSIHVHAAQGQEFRQFLWIFEEIEQPGGNVGRRLLENAGVFLQRVVAGPGRDQPRLPLLALTLAGLTVLAMPKTSRLKEALARRRPAMIEALVAFLLLLGFWTLDGLVSWRFTFSLATPLFLVAGVWTQAVDESTPDRRRWMPAALAVVALAAWTAWVLAQDGPFH